MNRRPLGFTLVELLVVIAIIGLLAAILLPFLGGAKDTAMVGTTKSMINNLALALKDYAQRYTDLPGYSKSGNDTPRDDSSEVVKYLVPLDLLDSIPLKNFGVTRDASMTATQSWTHPRDRNDLRTLSQSQDVFLLDDWGNVIHYVEYGSRNSSVKATAPDVTKTSFDAVEGITPASHTAQNLQFVDIWSNGINRKNNGGANVNDKVDKTKPDDVNNWQ
ncbi:MAG: type II secretion system protein [Planctomycetes bacterium]|nr:type II secretion system protein [Planctomycetota bacterium]